jgi:bifunctional DNase/RNase
MDIRERMINPRISQQQVLPTLISEIPKVRFRQDKDPADVLVLSLLRGAPISVRQAHVAECLLT